MSCWSNERKDYSLADFLRVADTTKQHKICHKLLPIFHISEREEKVGVFGRLTLNAGIYWCTANYRNVNLNKRISTIVVAYHINLLESMI